MGLFLPYFGPIFDQNRGFSLGLPIITRILQGTRGFIGFSRENRGKYGFLVVLIDFRGKYGIFSSF